MHNFDQCATKSEEFCRPLVLTISWGHLIWLRHRNQQLLQAPSHVVVVLLFIKYTDSFSCSFSWSQRTGKVWERTHIHQHHDISQGTEGRRYTLLEAAWAEGSHRLCPLVTIYMLAKRTWYLHQLARYWFQVPKHKGKLNMEVHGLKAWESLCPGRIKYEYPCHSHSI